MGVCSRRKHESLGAAGGTHRNFSKTLDLPLLSRDFPLIGRGPCQPLFAFFGSLSAI